MPGNASPIQAEYDATTVAEPAHAGRAGAGDLITIDGSRFVLESSGIRRVLMFHPAHGLFTQSLVNKLTGAEYARHTTACEFMARLNGRTLRGYSESVVHILDGTIHEHACRLGLTDTAIMTLSDGWQRLSLLMHVHDTTAQVIAHYDIHPELPAIRKQLQIIAGDEPLHIDKFMFEVLNCFPGSLPDIRMFGRQGLVPHAPFFISDLDDVIQLHNERLNEGMFVASPAPGPLRRFLVYPQWQETALCVGYNSDTAPFGKYLNPGESFESDFAITMIYAGDRDDPCNRNMLRQVIRDLLPGSVDDAFMYCTWLPFLKNINAPLIETLIDRAHQLGFSSFVIDDGWFRAPGWQVDTDKFPQGLEPISEAIRSRQMRFGLWFNIGTDYGDSNAFDHHLALDCTGRPKFGGFVSRNPSKCLASGHRDRIIAVLSKLASRYDVGYFKLDFSSIVSPYGLLPLGCHSQDHEYHRDAADAIYECYRSFAIIRRALLKQHPDLVVDFSFEAFGADHPHIGALMNSPLHHVSNMTSRDPAIMTARNIRNALYDFCTVLPNERILGSLISLEGPHAVEHLATSLIGAPLLAGDLRTLSDDQCAQIRRVIAAVRSLTTKGPLTEFARLHGDRHVGHDDWDGFARWGRSGAGLVCLFRNGCQDAVVLRLPDLTTGRRYQLIDAVLDEELGTYTANDLTEGVALPCSPEADVRILIFRPVTPLEHST